MSLSPENPRIPSENQNEADEISFNPEGIPVQVGDLESYLIAENLDPSQMTRFNHRQYAVGVVSFLNEQGIALKEHRQQAGKSGGNILPKDSIVARLNALFRIIGPAPAQQRAQEKRYLLPAQYYAPLFPQIQVGLQLSEQLKALEHPLAPRTTEALIAYGMAVSAMEKVLRTGVQAAFRPPAPTSHPDVIDDDPFGGLSV